jgi:hypothetical protein
MPECFLSFAEKKTLLGGRKKEKEKATTKAALEKNKGP